MKNFLRVLRIALTIWILFIVWNNAHWSVAVSLTLISLSIEAMAAALDILSRAFRAYMKGMQQAFEQKDVTDETP